MDYPSTLWTGLFPIAGNLCFVEILYNANSVDPDSAASDLGRHCLSITIFGVSRLKWVNFDETLNRLLDENIIISLRQRS